MPRRQYKTLENEQCTACESSAAGYMTGVRIAVGVKSDIEPCRAKPLRATALAHRTPSPILRPIREMH